MKGNREEFLNFMFGLLKKNLTVDTFLSADLMKLSKTYPNFYTTWKSNMERFVEISKAPFEIFAKNVTELKPLIIPIPVNFNEFNAEFLPKKCDKCGEFCQYCQTVVCLLCGVILCRDKCVHPPKKKKKQNLERGTTMTNGDSSGKKKKKKRKSKKKKDKDGLTLGTLETFGTNTTDDEINMTDDDVD
mmetsp:Transcript_20391/g.17700  ORF Transcript_20391/g.17700 Transcript_20391/m.17700 type:complete len:188 (-) Transcript_20391:958-1521(-)